MPHSHSPSRRALGRSMAALAGLSLGLPLASVAQGVYPDKPVRMVVGFAPGGSDISARIVAQKLSLLWGQSVIVDNKPGAGGNIGADIVSKSAPDG